MPTIEEQLNSAMQQLKRNCAYTSVPVLDETDDLEPILAETARASIWTDDTAYIFGAVVLPTVRNGHRYRCIQGGTSAEDAEDEPQWPLFTGRTITDGESDPQLIWQEDGPDYENVYDVRRATHKAWLLKAARASELYLTRQSGSTFEHQQIYQHCMEQAKAWAPINMA